MGIIKPPTFDADGNIPGGGIVRHDTGTTVPFYAHCNDEPDGLSVDYVENDDSATSTSAWFSLSNLDSKLTSVDTLSITIDGERTGSGDDTIVLTAQIFDADFDETNPLTNESKSLLSGVTSRDQKTIAFTGLTGTAAQWAGAYVKFSWTYTVVSTPDGDNLRIYGCKFPGTFTREHSASTLIWDLNLEVAEWPDDSIGNRAIDPTTDIEVEKLEHIYKKFAPLSSALTGEEFIVYVADNPTVIRGFKSGLDSVGTDTEVSFGLKLNGTSILHGDVRITESQDDREVIHGLLSTKIVAPGDVLSIELGLIGTPAQDGSDPYSWVEIQDAAGGR